MSSFSPVRPLILEPQSKHHALVSAWVTTREAFGIALEALRVHKLRSFLTLLGIVIATTTLIVVMSVIHGMNLYIAERIANLGANVFIVHQFQWAQGYEYWLKARRRNPPIRIEDYEFLKDRLRDYRGVGAVAPVRPRPDVRYQGHTLYESDVRGVTPSMGDIAREEVEAGRYITEAENAHSEMVCFIGQDIVNEFFPRLDPLNKVISVGGRPFRVVGVAKKIGTTFGQSADNFIVIPLTTAQKIFLLRPQLLVYVQGWNDRQMPELEDEVRALMRARRHLPYKDDDNFGINASETIMSAWQRLTSSLFAVTIGIVAVFMVVGGIVIMNIMLASVTERTHEIGIRKSLGARRRDILMQFVIESAVMAAAGGVVGIVLAVFLSRIIQVFFASSIPLTGVMLGVVLSTLVGLFFGIYPASRAADLDPIEALRTEN
jgi:putative ABC transport system permease protein